MRIPIIAFVLLSILASYHDSHKPIVKEDNSIDWQTIRITSRSQTIIIDRYEEYGLRDTCDFKEVKIDKYTTEYRPINRGQEYFDINQQDKDSLFKYIYDIVINPIYTE